MRSLVPLFLMMFALSLPAQQDKDLETIHKQAIAAYDKHDYVAALPLYEALLKDQPSSTVFQERTAACLLAAQPGDTPVIHHERMLRARKLLLQAKAGGDDSNLLQILLEKTADAEANPPSATDKVTPDQELINQAELVFGRGDFEGALALYKKAYETNPQNYGAALFAGDAEYKLGHTDAAGGWYAKAIAINGDMETAYRYWGDALEKAGRHQEAEEKFIMAVVRQPYQRAPRVGLKQWADANHAMIAPPPITLPNRPSVGKDGHINITLPMSSKKDDPEGPVNLVYQMGAATWQGEKFKKQFPNEKTYRDSLPEEVDTIHTMLKVADELKLPDDKLSTSVKLLRELDKQNMLECWILLDHPNRDLVADYAPYARNHMDLMAKYIAKYDVHLH